MPKGGGEKPKGPELLPVAEVARRLRVEPSQVEAWMQKDQLRGTENGVRPYDVKKFQLDYQEEIKKAQREALQEKQQPKSSRKPKKSGGILSKFKSIFGGSEETDASSDPNLAKENTRLKAELQKLKKAQGSGRGDDSKDLEEKVRFLETKVSETRALEDEITQLRRQLSQQNTGTTSEDQGAELLAQLEATRRELAEAQRQSAQSDRFREALSVAQEERERLEAALQRAQADRTAPAPPDHRLEELERALQQKDRQLASVQEQATLAEQENERLRASALQVSEPEPIPASSPLVEELLELQELNLARFRRLNDLYLATQSKLAEAQESASKEDSRELSTELQTLQSKYKLLLAKQGQETPAQREAMEQLTSARGLVAKLKTENEQLREQMTQAKAAATDQRIQELEQKLRQAEIASGQHNQLETELLTLRRGIEQKEGQVQKVAGKLAENEKRLSKALQESARLTELLIERETKLRELSDEFEQEYRDKIENLDRQVSGLQWKLSLREERIAHLEGELARKGG